MTRINNAAATGFAWVASSYSGGNNNCVEVAHGAIPSALPVRDSKAPAGPAVVMGGAAWAAFVDGVKAGDVA
ncbi:protein of unknown function DUF397 [Actinobacteria bacterium OK074]|nr:protein of unknown function DUF397 [Actinobacteria bacterium OK074]